MEGGPVSAGVAYIAWMRKLDWKLRFVQCPATGRSGRVAQRRLFRKGEALPEKVGLARKGGVLPEKVRGSYLA